MLAKPSTFTYRYTNRLIMIMCFLQICDCSNAAIGAATKYNLYICFCVSLDSILGQIRLSNMCKIYSNMFGKNLLPNKGDCSNKQTRAGEKGALLLQALQSTVETTQFKNSPQNQDDRIVPIIFYKTLPSEYFRRVKESVNPEFAPYNSKHECAVTLCGKAKGVLW